MRNFLTVFLLTTLFCANAGIDLGIPAHRKIHFVPKLTLSVTSNRSPFATTYYISTSGNDANSGTSIGSPWQHIEKIGGITFVPGDIVYIRGAGGTTYSSTAGTGSTSCTKITSQNGTSGAHILISAYPPDFPSGGRVTYDCTNVSHTVNCFGIWTQGCNYIDFYGIYVKGPSQTASGSTGTVTGCWYSDGCSNNLIENCEASDSETGFRLDDGSNTTYRNCDAHNQDDPFTGLPTGPHNNSDGFSRTAGGNVATGTTYYGCRSWLNADDGWDCFGTNGTITYDHCWSFKNGYTSGGAHLGDGNGFKMGGTPVNTGTLTRFAHFCVSFGNFANGYDQNDGTFIAQFYNNDAINNGGNDWKFGYHPPLAHVFQNNLSIGNAIIDGTSSDASAWGTNDHNSWNGSVVINTGDFNSMDGAQLNNARQADGSLPVITAFTLAAGSDLIDAGIDVELGFNGARPDMGAFESGAGGGGGGGGSIWYVSTAGNDANAGTSLGVAFLTLSKAETVVSAGDLVLVNTGTYTLSGLTMSHNGSGGSLIEFRSLGGTVTLNVNGTIDVTGTYRLINGFSLNCNTTSPIILDGANNQVTNCIFTGTFTRSVYVKTANNLIRKCTVTQASGTDYGIQVGENANTGGSAASNNTVDGCTVTGTAGAGQTIHGILFGGGGSGNILINSFVVGCYYGLVDKVETATLCYNNVFNLTAASLYTCIYDKGSTNSQYYNNICRTTNSGYCIILADGDGATPHATGAIIKNNIFIKNTSDYAIFINDVSETYTIDYNCFQYSSASNVVYNHGTVLNSLAAWQSASGQEAHSIAATALFVSGSPVNMVDFKTASGSPTINVGVTMSGRSTDAAGSPLVGTPDIGAYEFGSVGATPHSFFRRFF